MASSLDEDKSIDTDTGDKQKLSVIIFYNRVKGGVDTTDKLCESYNVAKKCAPLANGHIFCNDKHEWYQRTSYLFGEWS